MPCFRVRRSRILFFPPDPGSARAGWRTASDAQPLYHAAVPQVLFHDLVDVGAVHVAVPDSLRVDDDARPFLAAIQAPRLVHPHLARPGESQLLDALLGVIAHFAGALGVATG